MTTKISTALQNTLVTALSTALGNTTAVLDIYTGAQPADANTAASGTLLASITIASDWAAASAGSQALNATESAVAGNTGTAGWARLHDAGGTVKVDGTVGTSGTQYIINSTAITSGGTVNLTGCTLTQPAN